MEIVVLLHQLFQLEKRKSEQHRLKVDKTVQKLEADLRLNVRDFTPRKLKLTEWDLNATLKAEVKNGSFLSRVKLKCFHIKTESQASRRVASEVPWPASGSGGSPAPLGAGSTVHGLCPRCPWQSCPPCGCTPADNNNKKTLQHSNKIWMKSRQRIFDRTEIYNICF